MIARRPVHPPTPHFTDTNANNAESFFLILLTMEKATLPPWVSHLGGQTPDAQASLMTQWRAWGRQEHSHLLIQI
jgi:hypothetical protein